MANPGITTVPVTVPWRDVIHLDIKDPALKAHVEGFLNQFERSSYPYQRQDPRSGQITEERLSGQDILARLKQTQDLYRQVGGAQLSGQMQQVMARLGMQYADGKFTIGDHNRPANGGPANGSITMFADQGGALPMGIQIGTDYLKRSMYPGVDGKMHPVTVDGVIAHELAHLAFKTRQEGVPLQIEGIVVAAMGGEQRDPNSSVINLNRQSPGYETLYDKQTQRRGDLTPIPGAVDFASLTGPTANDINRHLQASRPRTGTAPA